MRILLAIITVIKLTRSVLKTSNLSETEHLATSSKSFQHTNSLVMCVSGKYKACFTHSKNPSIPFRTKYATNIFPMFVLLIRSIFAACRHAKLSFILHSSKILRWNRKSLKISHSVLVPIYWVRFSQREPRSGYMALPQSRFCTPTLSRGWEQLSQPLDTFTGLSSRWTVCQG